MKDPPSPFMDPHVTADTTFSELGLAPSVLAVLTRLKFTVPTPIQTKAIPIAVEGKDLVGIAQTGTGKTLAFAAPLLQRVAHTKKRGLILLPTRELALQVEETLQEIGRSFHVRTALLIGGGSMLRQKEALKRNPHVIVGTPGRIIDHLQQRTLHLRDIGILVLDEADRMLDMGFAPQLAQILEHVPKERQTMLFSATMPSVIHTMAARHMKMPVRIEVAPAGTVAERVHQEFFVVGNNQKNRLLDKILNEHTGSVLVFSRTKHGAKKLCRAVRAMGHSVEEIHSNLSLSKRRASLEGFKRGTHRVLVATDIAARGIDVTNIELVVNYDAPNSPEDYVHRVGRTGRAGKVGHAMTFLTPDQRGKLRSIEQLIRASVRITPLPELPPERAHTAQVEMRPSSYPTGSRPPSRPGQHHRGRSPRGRFRGSGHDRPYHRKRTHQRG